MDRVGLVDQIADAPQVLRGIVYQSKNLVEDLAEVAFDVGTFCFFPIVNPFHFYVLWSWILASNCLIFQLLRFIRLYHVIPQGREWHVARFPAYLPKCFCLQKFSIPPIFVAIPKFLVSSTPSRWKIQLGMSRRQLSFFMGPSLGYIRCHSSSSRAWRL